MDKDLMVLEQLLSLIDERDTGYDEYTEAIVDLLEPTVLAALLELFCVTEQQIEWVDAKFNEIDETLHLECAVMYNETDVIPQFVKDVTKTQHHSDENEARIVHVGIPLGLVFQPKAELVAFFQEIIAMNSTRQLPDHRTPQSSTEFDATQLTEEQIRQLLVFQHGSLGSKH